MDGLGAAPKHRGNAVTLAKPKNLGVYWNTHPHTYLLASAEAVGLPENTKGNSEVGHINIGAGRIINQNLPRINKAIDNGLYMNNDTLWAALKHAIKHKGRVHLMGVASDGSVHAHIDHFKATVEFFAKNNYNGELFVHAFTDGRDSYYKGAKDYLNDLDDTFQEYGMGQIGSVCGRAYSMDRNHQWDRTERAYKMLTQGDAPVYTDWIEAIDTSYAQEKYDEFLEPAIIKKQGSDPTIKENDAVIFMNFRADRAIQITDTFINPAFSEFPVKSFTNLFFAGMVEYRKGQPANVLFPKEYINLTVGKIISTLGIRQLRIAESEKFPHVTYFFNGGLSIKHRGEDRINVPSPDVQTYDLKPEMSAMKILEILTSRINNDMYEFIVLNLANPDMVGHSGNLAASIKSIEVVDHIVGELTRRFTARGGAVILTSDHGNVEEVINLDTGEIDTEHSLNPVPFMIIDKDMPARMLPYGALKDISPTILDLMGIPKPTEMTGRSLLSGF